MSTRTSVPRRAALATLSGLATLPLIGCGTSTRQDGPPPRSGSTPSPSTPSTSTRTSTADTKGAFARLEHEFDARLGVYAIDTGNGRSITHRPDERFAYASTCKALLAAVMLDTYSLRQLDRLVRYDRNDLAGAGYSPITEKHLATGLTLRQLCDATVRHSDNGAANLLFREIGGPKRLQNALASIGDRVTRCDRYEDDLSEAVPGDLRDTSTPRALATDLRAYVVDDALAPDKRAVLTDWLKRNTTGDKVIRAGAPDGWQVGDKTGTGGYGTRNDIAVVWPPKAAPIAIAVLSRRDFKDAEPDDALIAEAAEITLNALA